MTDEELMLALKGGSEQALQLLHVRYAPLLYGTAARSLGPAAAEDIVQEVLLSAWQARERLEPERGELRGWLLEIAHTKILNELRRRRRHPSEALNPADIAASTEGPPEALVWEEQRRRALNLALAELPPAEGRALRLAFFGELSHAEVATFLEAPLGTVKSRVRAGLARLLRRLDPLLGSALLGLTAAAGMLWVARLDSRMQGRAVRMLSLSDSQVLRMGAAPGAVAETHGTFRWHPDVGTAVVTLSHPPPLQRGARYVAWADFGEGWVPLCEPVPAGAERDLCIAEVAGVGRPPKSLMISAERSAEASSAGRPSGPEVTRWDSAP